MFNADKRCCSSVLGARRITSFIPGSIPDGWKKDRWLWIVGWWFWVCGLSWHSGKVFADVRLPALFSDRMVMQAGRPIPVWGWATPGEQVVVNIAGQQHITTADPQGRWRVTLRPLRVRATLVMRVQGRNRIIVRDIWIGEVWLCSGQSNMWWPVRLTLHGKETMAQQNYPWLRLFTVPIRKSRIPQQDVTGQWSKATPDVVKDFSAVCFHFGQFLQQEYQIPVGLIASSVGGTRAEAWTPHETLAQSPVLREAFVRQKQWEKQRPAMWVQYQKQLAVWQQQAKQAKTTGKPQPQLPWYPPEAWHHNSPAALYNAMIAPLIPYAIRGVLWYQGESNIQRATQYQHLFSRMIGAWRQRWQQGPFSFLFVQLAPFRYRYFSRDAYNRLCEAQAATAHSVANTAMVSTHDIATIHDIHPPNKREVGRRLFLAAQNVAYGKKEVVFSGPVYRSMTRKGERLVLSFSHTHGGLVAKGGSLRAFEIADNRRKFVPAQAEIVGERVEVWSPAMKEPVAVRLAWRDDVIHNLFNGAGFPAKTFRTDRWP